MRSEDPAPIDVVTIRMGVHQLRMIVDIVEHMINSSREFSYGSPMYAQIHDFNLEIQPEDTHRNIPANVSISREVL